MMAAGCSVMQGLDPKLLNYHYKPRRAAQFFSISPSKTDASVSACLKGIPRKCVDVAAQMLLDENEKGAYKFFEIACNLDYGKGCFGAGNIESDRKKLISAKAFFEKGCKYKFGPSCFALAEASLIEGLDESDQKYRYETYGYACDLRGDYGCVRLGELYYKNGNEGLARYYFHRSCSLKNELGCYNLGFLYYKEEKLRDSLESLRLSCKYGQPEGCYQMARHYGHHKNDRLVFYYLNEAFKNYYTNWERVEFDPYFDFLRKRDSFRDLIDSFLLSKRLKNVSEESDHQSQKVIAPKEEAPLK